MAVFNIIDRVKPVFDFIYFVVMQVAKAFLVATVLIACLMVLGRYIGFVPSFPWTEEVILMLMTYMSLLGASLAVRRRAHIRMVAIDPFLPKIVIRVLDLLADAAIIFFCYILLTEGWTYAVTIGGRGSFTSMPNLSLFWRFLPIPLGGGLMLFFSIEVCYNNIKAFFVKEEKDGEA